LAFRRSRIQGHRRRLLIKQLRDGFAVSLAHLVAQGRPHTRPRDARAKNPRTSHVAQIL
jgi:hypothetical protein